MSVITVRDYTDADYDNVRRNLIEGGLYDPIWDSRESLSQKIKRNPGSILVADDGVAAVGSIYIVEDGWGAFIFRLAVRASHRGREIGSLLMTEAESALRRKGYKDVALFVEDAQEPLKRYYARLGYETHSAYRCMVKFFGQPR